MYSWPEKKKPCILITKLSLKFMSWLTRERHLKKVNFDLNDYLKHLFVLFPINFFVVLYFYKLKTSKYEFKTGNLP